MNKYDSVIPTEEGKLLIEQIRRDFKGFDAILEKALPNGRLKSLALTHLENAAMWSIKSISHEGAKNE